MAMNRTVCDSSNNKQQLLNQIDSCLKKSYSALAHGLTKGKDKPEGNTFHQFNFFNQLWTELNGVLEFDSIDELNSYYKNIYRFLPEKIIDYYSGVGLPVKMNKAMQEIFYAIVSFFQSIARQKFYLSKMHEVDTLASIVQMVEQQCEEIEKINSHVNLEVLTRELAELNVGLKLILDKINFSGYGKINIDFNPEENPIKEVNLTSLRVQLERLPRTNHINIIIEKLYKAVNSSDKPATLKAQEELKAQINIIEIVRSEICKLLEIMFNNYDNELNIVAQDCERMNKLLVSLSEKNAILQNIRDTVINILGYKAQDILHAGFRDIEAKADNLIAACKQQNKLEKNIFVARKHWSQTSHDLLVATHDLHTNFTEFSNAHQIYLSTIENLGKRIEKYKQNYTQLNALMVSFKSLKQKAIDIKNEFNNIMQSAVRTLSEHTNNSIDYLKDFFKRHGGKVAFGGTFGVGVGLTIAIIASLNPPGMILLVTSTVMIGTSIGGGVGLTSDILENKKKKDHKPRPAAEKPPEPPAATPKKKPAGLRQDVNRMWRSHPTIHTIDNEIIDIRNTAQYKFN